MHGSGVCLHPCSSKAAKDANNHLTYVYIYMHIYICIILVFIYIYIYVYACTYRSDVCLHPRLSRRPHSHLCAWTVVSTVHKPRTRGKVAYVHWFRFLCSCIHWYPGSERFEHFAWGIHVHMYEHKKPNSKVHAHFGSSPTFVWLPYKWGQLGRPWFVGRLVWGGFLVVYYVNIGMPLGQPDQLHFGLASFDHRSSCTDSHKHLLYMYIYICT